MGALTIGASITIPELPGKWSVWSKSDECPGAYFIVPKEGGSGYAVIRATQTRQNPNPIITLIRREGPGK